MKKSTLKKITSAAVSALYIMSGASQPGLPAYSEDTVYYYGDLNGDKVLDVFDLCMMRQAYLHPETLDALHSELCDMSANDSFDDSDLIIMKDYLLGKISTYPSGPIYTPPAEPQIYNGQRTLNGSRRYEYILGDWREEIICVGPDFNSLVLLSTTAPSEYRINCLAQDPAYRNDMTSKGYYQSNMVSYYLGNGMDAPPVPDISYIGSEITFSEDKVWGIRNVNSGRCMDVYKSGTEDGTNVQQYGTVANKSNNTWRIKDAGEGYVYIISQLSNGRTGYLTVENGTDQDGANVIISSFTGNDEQKFRLKNSGGGYVILTKCSDEKRCIEVEAAAANAGANVQQWALNGNSCQSWRIENIK